MLWCFLLLWISPRCADSFSVTVPSGPVLVVRGATAFLSCEFEPDSNISNLVITWQREEDTRVVHSFYYQRDQLDRQSSDYFNRTNLNHSELAKGNASLSIANFGLKDAGKYLCTVSNTKGTGKGVLELVYAAFFSEPRLSIHLKSSDVTVQYEMEGYPRPEVMWLGSGGQNLSDHQEVSSASDGGLYYLKSRYVTQNPAFNITFTLKNPTAHQELQRHVILSYGKQFQEKNADLLKKHILLLSMLNQTVHTIMVIHKYQLGFNNSISWFCETAKKQCYLCIEQKQSNLGFRFQAFPLSNISPVLESFSNINAGLSSCLIVTLLFPFIFL